MLLRDFDSLDEQNVEKNNQLAFDVAEKELGISPIMTGKEMAAVAEPDKLSMVMYLTQFYEMFKDSLSSSGEDLRAQAGLLASCCLVSRAVPRALLHTLCLSPVFLTLPCLQNPSHFTTKHAEPIWSKLSSLSLPHSPSLSQTHFFCTGDS